jgi:glycosyltransferase involved in cell wall biosynthesis
MYQIIGPVGTLKRILADREFFLEQGLDISVYNRGHFYKSIDELKSDNKGQVYGLKHKLFEKLNKSAHKSFFLAILLLEYRFRSFKKVIDGYIKEGRTPDIAVLHAHEESYWWLKAMENKKVNRIKTAVFLHSDCIPLKMELLYYPKLKGSFYERLMLKRYEYVLNNADRLCFICEAGQINMNRLYPQTVSKSALIINGITDLTIDEKIICQEIASSRTDNTINLCCVGSVSVRKAQRKVIEAMSMMSPEARENYHLTVIGDGTDLEYCKEQVKKNGLEDRVTFTGAVPNTEVYKYLASSDVFVLLSENEGLPISIIEAMRAGLAVVSTNVSGIPELVNNNNGVLIKPDANELMKVLMEGDYNWKQMGRNSRKLFEQKFTFVRMRRDYVAMIKSL